MLKVADIETPYMSANEDTLQRNIFYARLACSWALKNGYVPYASHLFFTQPGILDDDVPEERALGIEAGKNLIRAAATHTLVFTDLGESGGMLYGIQEAEKVNRTIIKLRLFPENIDVSQTTLQDLISLAKEHHLFTGKYYRKGWSSSLT